jgi:predicted GNAT family acetyltransferase
MRSSGLAVIHEETKRRFVGTLANTAGESYLEYRYVTPSKVDFFRTVTEPEMRGKGAAGEVVRAALTWAQEKKLEVKASCSYVEHFLQKNPEFTRSEL